MSASCFRPPRPAVSSTSAIPSRGVSPFCRVRFARGWPPHSRRRCPRFPSSRRSSGGSLSFHRSRISSPSRSFRRSCSPVPRPPRSACSRSILRSCLVCSPTRSPSFCASSSRHPRGCRLRRLPFPMGRSLDSHTALWSRSGFSSGPLGCHDLRVPSADRSDGAAPTGFGFPRDTTSRGERSGRAPRSYSSSSLGAWRPSYGRRRPAYACVRSMSGRATRSSSNSTAEPFSSTAAPTRRDSLPSSGRAFPRGIAGSTSSR